MKFFAVCLLFWGLFASSLPVMACEGNRNTIVYTNGINTTRAQARRALVDTIRPALNSELKISVDRTCLEFALAYNGRFIGGDGATVSVFNVTLQIIESMVERGIDVAANFWTYWNRLFDVEVPSWLDNIQRTAIFAATSPFIPDVLAQELFYSAELGRGQRLIVIAHSQGNLHVNHAFSTVTSSGGGDRFKVLAIASPATYVAGGGAHITLSGDIITFVPGSLPGNTVNNTPSYCLLLARAVDCHLFVTSYMAGDVTRPAIVGAVDAIFALGAPIDRGAQMATPEWLAMSRSGTAIALWSEYGPGGLWANDFRPERGWVGPARIADPGRYMPGSGSVAVNDSGDAVAAWRSLEEGRVRVIVRRAPRGSSWLPLERIGDGDNDALTVRVDIDSEGRIALVWLRLDSMSGRLRVVSSRYWPSLGWSTPTNVDSGIDRVLAPSLTLDVNGSGAGVLVWASDSGVRHEIWASRLGVISGWSVPQKISQDDLVRITDPTAARMNDRGDVIAAWTGQDSSGREMVSSRLLLDNVWLDSTNLVIEGKRHKWLTAAIGDTGRAGVGWYSEFGPTGNQFMISLFSASGGWEPPHLVESMPFPGSALPNIEIDSRGKMIAAWQGGGGIMYQVNSLADGWSLPVVAAAGEVGYSHLATDNSGLAMLLWGQMNPGESVMRAWAGSFKY